jgi:hypothetical protein
MFDVLGRKGRFSNLGFERSSIQEHDPRRHAGTPALPAPALFVALTAEWLRQ